MNWLSQRAMSVAQTGQLTGQLAQAQEEREEALKKIRTVGAELSQEKRRSQRYEDAVRRGCRVRGHHAGE